MQPLSADAAHGLEMFSNVTDGPNLKLYHLFAFSLLLNLFDDHQQKLALVVASIEAYYK